MSGHIFSPTGSVHKQASSYVMATTQRVCGIAEAVATARRLW